jgi:hypothetical protein
MYFSKHDVTTRKSNSRNALALSPSAASIALSQPSQLPDARTYRDGLDCADLADDFERHVTIVPDARTRVN